MLLIAIRRVLPAHARRANTRLDTVGAALATASIAFLTFGLSQGQQHGFPNPAVLAALAVAFFLGVALAIAQKCGRAPMVPLPVLARSGRGHVGCRDR